MSPSRHPSSPPTLSTVPPPAPSFTVASDTQLTAVAPAGSGTVQITVTTPGGTSNGLAYTYVSVPAVSGVRPNQGPPSGGDTVTVTGATSPGRLRSPGRSPPPVEPAPR